MSQKLSGLAKSSYRVVRFDNHIAYNSLNIEKGDQIRFNPRPKKPVLDFKLKTSYYNTQKSELPVALA